MPVIVHIPSPLRPYVGGRDRVEVEAKTVAEVLERLTTEHDQLKTHLFKDDGTVRSFVNLFLNNRDIRDMSEGDTRTADGDELSIVPSIAGERRPSGPSCRNCRRRKSSDTRAISSCLR